MGRGQRGCVCFHTLLGGVMEGMAVKVASMDCINCSWAVSAAAMSGSGVGSPKYWKTQALSSSGSRQMIHFFIRFGLIAFYIIENHPSMECEKILFPG